MDPSKIKAARILILDDIPANVRLLEMILETAGYTNVYGITNPLLLDEMLATHHPDLLLLDLHMPALDGYSILENLQNDTNVENRPQVLVLTADVTHQARNRALKLGARDFVNKPFEAEEVIARAGNLVEMRLLHLEAVRHSTTLEDRVAERTKELQQAEQEIIDRLSAAAEYRDDVTGKHTSRVGTLAALLAVELGLSNEQVGLIRRAAPLHDIGKIGIPDSILLKPAKLTTEEFEVIKSHVTIGANLLAGSSFPLLQTACEIARTHHEWWDGSGYCQGLRFKEIPLSGRIVAVVDVFDALTHERPYKKAWSVSDAVAEIVDRCNKQFCPDVVSAFIKLYDTGAIERLPVAQRPSTPDPCIKL